MYHLIMLKIAKMNGILLSEILLSPQFLYCPVIQRIMKLLQVFVNSLPSQVAIDLDIIKKFTVKKFYVIYRYIKHAFSEGNFWRSVIKSQSSK